MARYDEYLGYFAQDVLDRALQYYEDENVKDLKRVSSDIITGTVEGTNARPYEVRIDLRHPYESECDCPYAEKGKMCKHMAAVFFAAFPEQAQAYEDYNERMFDDYEEEYEDEEEEDNGSALPFNYDTLLDQFIAGLNEEEKNSLLKELLNEHPEAAYRRYLQTMYQETLQQKDTGRIEEIWQLIAKKRYDCPEDFSQQLIPDDIRAELEAGDDNTKEQALKLLKDTGLYNYEDAPWMAKYICKYDTETGKNRFANEMEEHTEMMSVIPFRSLHPANNCLKAVYELRKEWDQEELAYSLLKYLGLTEYTDYVISDSKDPRYLYEEFRKKMTNTVFRNKQIHTVLHQFADVLHDEEIQALADYYDFVYNFNRVAFDRLRISPQFEEVYLPQLLKQKPHIVQETYAQLQRTDDLFALLKEENDIWGMIRHAPLLDTSYHEELKKIFSNEFYRYIEKSENRKDYENACQYIRALSTLSDGEAIIDGIVEDLKNKDRYAKRRALFEEIDKAR